MQFLRKNSRQRSQWVIRSEHFCASWQALPNGCPAWLPDFCCHRWCTGLTLNTAVLIPLFFVYLSRFLLELCVIDFKPCLSLKSSCMSTTFEENTIKSSVAWKLSFQTVSYIYITESTKLSLMLNPFSNCFLQEKKISGTYILPPLGMKLCTYLWLLSFAIIYRIHTLFIVWQR